jgi:hypothetical protein
MVRPSLRVLALALAACSDHDPSASVSAGGTFAATTGDTGRPGDTGTDAPPTGDPDPCAAGQHACDGACVDDASVDHCGAACEPCPADPHGDPVCDGGACGLACDPGALLCEGACAPCPAGPAHACAGPACVTVCPEGQDACDTGCCDLGLVFDTINARKPSITVDADNNPHIAFSAFVGDRFELMYATREADPWQITQLVSENAAATAIALGPDGRPRIAYTDNYSVWLARFDGAQWIQEEVIHNTMDMGPDTGETSLALDSAGHTHIASSQSNIVRHMAWDGAAWQIEKVVELTEDTPTLPSIAIDADDAVHIGWRAVQASASNYTTNRGGAWTTEFVEDNAGCCDTAYLALDPAGAPALAFRVRDTGLTLAARTGDAWTSETVHTDRNLDRTGNIAFDSAGGVHYALSTETGELIHGSPDGSGWTEATITASPIDFMFAIDGEDRVHYVVATAAGLEYHRL